MANMKVIPKTSQYFILTNSKTVGDFFRNVRKVNVELMVTLVRTANNQSIHFLLAEPY